MNKISKIKQILIKNTWFIINFTFGLLVGYGFGISQIYKIFFQNIHFEQNSNLWIQAFLFLDQFMWKPFLSFSPSFKFVSDVIAYQAAIVAIAIPVSLDIISRISERYQSGIITKEFNQQWQLRTLLVLVIADALSGVILKFFVVSSTETVSTIGWKIVTWIILLFFIATNIVLFAFFNNLRKYSTSTKFLLDKLFDEIDQCLKIVLSKKKISDAQIRACQEKIVGAFEGIGDILIFESKNKKNSQYIIDGIYKIREKTRKFFSINQHYPDRFQKLLYSEEIFKSHESKNIDASLEIAFYLDKYLTGYMVIVNQLVRLYEAALEAKNFEISKFSIYGLLDLLEELSQDKNSNTLLETLLGTLSELFSSSQEQPDYLPYLLATNWYVDIVSDKKFNIENLKYFDNTFAKHLRQIIHCNKYTLFESFLSRLHSAGGFNNRNKNLSIKLSIRLLELNNQSYIDLECEHQIKKKIDKLTKNIEEVRTIQQFRESLSFLKNIKTSIDCYFKIDDEQTI